MLTTAGGEVSNVQLAIRPAEAVDVDTRIMAINRAELVIRMDHFIFDIPFPTNSIRVLMASKTINTKRNESNVTTRSVQNSKA